MRITESLRTSDLTNNNRTHREQQKKQNIYNRNKHCKYQNTGNRRTKENNGTTQTNRRKNIIKEERRKVNKWEQQRDGEQQSDWEQQSDGEQGSD